MTRYSSVLLTSFIIFFAGCSRSITLREYEIQANIHINQIGYYPSSPKYCILSGIDASVFDVVDNKGKVAFTGTLTEAVGQDSLKILQGDFSQLKKQGTYQIFIPSEGLSAPFNIDKDIYSLLLRASLKSYFFQRASINLDSLYAWPWVRKAGHADTACILHPSSGKTGIRSSKGGWYDAGDFGKYVVNAGITVATMMSLHERFPGMISDNFTGIPESGNGKSDLLDEIKYELDWLKTMQDDDGGVFFKVAGLSWPGFIMPEHDTIPRYIIGKSTTSTLCFAANMAQASRVYHQYDSSYAKDCLDRAQKAWIWAQENPAVGEPQEMGGSGGYGVEQHGWIDTTCAGPQYLVKGNDVFTDEFFWAASELYISSGNQLYASYLKETLPALRLQDVPAWWDLQGLGYYSLLLTENGLGKQDKELILNRLIDLGEKHRDNIENSAYRVPYDCFFWGSNASFLNIAVLFSYLFDLTKDQSWKDAALESVDYVLGKNATGYSFVTGFGHTSPHFPHHRQCGADNVKEPISGFIVGGPNVVKQDDINKVSWGAKYPFNDAPRSYVDDQNSYASNEFAINWNAPLVHIMGFLVNIQD